VTDHETTLTDEDITTVADEKQTAGFPVTDADGNDSDSSDSDASDSDSSDSDIDTADA
jgi:hypothetical protein